MWLFIILLYINVNLNPRMYLDYKKGDDNH